MAAVAEAARSPRADKRTATLYLCAMQARFALLAKTSTAAGFRGGRDTRG